MPRLPTKLTEKQEKTVFELASKGIPDKKIAESTKLPLPAITRTINDKFPYIRDLDLYSQHKVSILNGVQHMALRVIADRIPDANIRDLVGLVSLFEDKINLREGRSTQNIGLAIKIEHLVDAKDKREENGQLGPSGRQEIPMDTLRTLLNGEVPKQLENKGKEDK